MEDSREIELKIHFGGSMKKIGEEDYEYLLEMKKLRYVYDSMDEEMGMMRYVGDLGKEVVEVFVEHECSEHIPGVIHLSSGQRDDVEVGDEEEEHSKNDEVDRPKKDDEPEESSDDNQAEKEIVEGDSLAMNLSVMRT
ncbi:hypothetical protein Bca4012_086469 [Brassica carinata]